MHTRNTRCHCASSSPLPGRDWGALQENLILPSRVSGCRGRCPSEPRQGWVCVTPGWGRAVLSHGIHSVCPFLRAPSPPHGNQAGFVFPGCPASGPGQESCCEWKQLLCSPQTSLALCHVLRVGKMERLGGSSWGGAGTAGSAMIILPSFLWQLGASLRSPNPATAKPRLSPIFLSWQCQVSALGSSLKTQGLHIF